VALDTRIKLTVASALTGAIDLQPLSAPLNLAYSKALTTGTGANQADKLWSNTSTIAASGTDTIDLAGSLTDAFGAALTFARIKAVFVVAAAGNSNNVNVVRPASNGVPLFLAAGDGVAVRPGGMFSWVCGDATGVAVTAGTGDLLDIVNSAGGTSVSYDVAIIGCSA
jgi:hypothetical protein